MHLYPVRTARYGSASEAAGASRTKASNVAAVTVPVFIALPLLLGRRAVLYPLADHVGRRLRKIRPAIRHAVPQRLRAFELLDDEARVGISWDHADQVRVAGTCDVDQVARGETGIEPQPLLRARAAVAARDGAVDVKDVRLNGIKRRREPRHGRRAAPRKGLPVLVEPLAAAGSAGGEGEGHDRDRYPHEGPVRARPYWTAIFPRISPPPQATRAGGGEGL